MAQHKPLKSCTNAEGRAWIGKNSNTASPIGVSQPYLEASVTGAWQAGAAALKEHDTAIKGGADEPSDTSLFYLHAGLATYGGSYRRAISAISDIWDVTKGGTAPIEGSTYTVNINGTDYIATYHAPVQDEWTATVDLTGAAPGDTYTLQVGVDSHGHTVSAGSHRRYVQSILTASYNHGAGGSPLIFRLTGSEGSWAIMPGPGANAASIATDLVSAATLGTYDRVGVLVTGSPTIGNHPRIAIAGDTNSPYTFAATTTSDHDMLVGLAAAINDPMTGSTTYVANVVSIGGGYALILTAVTIGAAGVHAITKTNNGTCTLMTLHLITGTTASSLWTFGNVNEVITSTLVATGPSAEEMVAHDNSATGPDEYESYPPTITDGTTMDDATTVAAALVAAFGSPVGWHLSNTLGVISIYGNADGTPLVVTSSTDGGGSFVADNVTPGHLESDPIQDMADEIQRVVDPLYTASKASGKVHLVAKATGAKAPGIVTSSTDVTPSGTFTSVNTTPGQDASPATTMADLLGQIVTAASADPDYDVSVYLGTSLDVLAKVAGAQTRAISTSTTSTGDVTFETTQVQVGTDIVGPDHAILNLDTGTLVADYEVQPGDTNNDIAIALSALVDADADYSSYVEADHVFRCIPAVLTDPIAAADESTSVSGAIDPIVPGQVTPASKSYTDGVVFDIRGIDEFDIIAVLDSGTSYKLQAWLLYEAPVMTWVKNGGQVSVTADTITTIQAGSASFVFIELSDFVGGAVASIGLVGK